MDTEDDLIFLDDGSSEAPQARRRRRWPWLLLAVAVAAGAVVANRHSPAPSAARRVASPAPSFQTAPVPQPPGPAPVTVIRLGHPLLGETGNWVLYGRGDGAVIRVDLARGEITRTVVPFLQSSGPVAFVPAADEVIIRPLDNVPGYAVPDGRPAQPLPPGFGSGGPVFPGPDPGQVWVVTDDVQPSTAVLTSLDGHRSGPVLRLPTGSIGLDATADGAGYLLVSASDGVYRTQPGRVRRISTGNLLATGPTGWLVGECDRYGHCRRVLIDRTTGRRRLLGLQAANGGVMPPWGAISPDGRTAAVFDLGSDGSRTIELLDLRTGSRHATGLHLPAPLDDGTIRWSPDSRWLFALDEHGELAVVARATGQVGNLSGSLPSLNQLAVRTNG